jgi:hypothetical protein
MTEREQLIENINEYLTNGGLFNPELMDHFAVRDLFVSIRDYLQAARAAPANPLNESESAVLRWMNRVIDAEERLARAAPAQRECKCDLRTRLVGDGCDVCNPELAAELAAPAQSEGDK